jgi:hypothetical protein
MTTLLIITVGQTDVQLVVNGQRHKLDGNTCGTLHDAIKERSWSVIDAPSERSRDLVKALPEGEVKLCTPKLDAVIARLNDTPPTSVLIFETNRQDARDPRLAGEVMERRLRDRGVNQVIREAFLTGTEQLEDPSNDVDAVVRQTVVATLSAAIKNQIEQLTKNDKVFVATTGGLAAANELIIELVRLHAVGGPTVTALEVPDGDRGNQADRAVEEKFHPAAGYRARWHALSLVEKGNLLGAWGAVSHLKDAPGQEWTQVIEWLALFASSLPLPTNCDLAVLSHQRMAVRSALRVELALRAGDIPRAVHGTVAFFEAALWDRLKERTTAHSTKKRLFRLNPTPAADLVRERDTTKLAGLSRSKQDEDKKKPFIFKETDEYGDWYWIDDNEVCAVRLAEHYLGSETLKSLGQAVNKTRDLRNDVAHNEPTPELMKDARSQMQEAKLWSDSEPPTFLSQPLVQDVLRELGKSEPSELLEGLLAEVRRRLIEPTATWSAS